MERSIAQLRDRANCLLADLHHARKTLLDEKVALVAAREAVGDAEEAQKIAQLVAQTVQQQAHERIASTVSRCLAAVFDRPYKFKIIFEQKRGRTEARLVFERDGNELDPLSASGGGVVDVAAFALRLAALLLTRPPLRRVLVLDEPFRFVSVQYRERVRDLLEQLSDELGVQLIMVTHIEDFEVGTVIRL